MVGIAVNKKKKTMKIRLKKQNGILIPSLPMDQELLNTWNEGDIIECETKKIRNPKFHRLVFAFFNFIFNSQEKYETLPDLIIEFKLRAGYFSEHVTVKGVLVYIPKSISFADCDELQFRVLYDKFIDIGIKYFVPKMTKLDVEKAVELILNFS